MEHIKQGYMKNTNTKKKGLIYVYYLLHSSYIFWHYYLVIFRGVI